MLQGRRRAAPSFSSREPDMQTSKNEKWVSHEKKHNSCSEKGDMFWWIKVDSLSQIQLLPPTRTLWDFARKRQLWRDQRSIWLTGSLKFLSKSQPIRELPRKKVRCRVRIRGFSFYLRLPAADRWMSRRSSLEEERFFREDWRTAEIEPNQFFVLKFLEKS